MPWGLGPEVTVPLPHSAGFSVRVTDDVRKSVVFFGYADTSRPSGIVCIGTGFLLIYKGGPYLVTAKHLSHQLGADPFLLRVNRKDGTAENLHADGVQWFDHSDPEVDASATPLHIGNDTAYAAMYLSGDEMLLSPEKLIQEDIGIGSLTYTVGLFRLLSGERRNLPICHFGAVAALPEDERIPIVDWTDPAGKRRLRVEGYLVESQSIGGLSGSPVFVRPELGTSMGHLLKRTSGGNDPMPPVTLPRNQVRLLGLWQGAWEAPADEIRAAQTGTNVVPVGMGVVVPGHKLIELLEREDVTKKRNEYLASRKPDAAIPQAVPYKPAVPSSDAKASEKNPDHREDFKRLLGAAVKPPKSSG